MDPYRAERVAQTLREELDEILNYELADPRIGSVAVADVVLAPDLRRVQVRVLAEGDAQRQRAALEALMGARGFVRRCLMGRLELFRVPEIRFELALAPEVGTRAAQLLRRIRRGRPRDRRDAPPAGGAGPAE